MEIRRFEDRSDVRGIIRVHGLAWREAYDGILPEAVLQDRSIDPTEKEVTQWFESFRSNQDGVLVATDSNDTVRGFADFRWGDVDTKQFVGANEAGLRAIYVEPAHWKDGIGTALLRRGLDLLPQSITCIRLEVFAANDRAQQFYEARGFDPTDTGVYEIAGEQYPTQIYTRACD